METKQTDVYDAVLGLIKACGPCGFSRCMAECKTQVIGFEKLTDFDATLKVDNALNMLLGEQKIEIGSGSFDGGYDISFDVAAEPERMPNLGVTVRQFFNVLNGFVKAGSCLIDDIYGVHKINRVTIEKNSKGKDAGFVFQSER